MTKYLFFSFVFLFSIAWVGGRLFVFDSLCKRARECAALYPSRNAPYHSNYNSYRAQIVGDLAVFSDRKSVRFPRSEAFYTDKFGYRTNFSWKESKVFLFGNSFAAGEGVSQEFMPASALSTIIQQNVWSGGGISDLRQIYLVLSEQKELLKNISVIYLYLDRQRLEETDFPSGPFKLESMRQKYAFRNYKEWIRSFHRYDPLSIFLRGLTGKYLSTSTPSHEVTEAETQYGKHLFLTEVFDREDVSASNLETEVLVMRRFTDEVKRLGASRMLFFGVPEKNSIYLPARTKRTKDYLTQLSARAQEMGVSFYDLSPVLRQALSDSSRDESRAPLFFPDDTHWAPNGIEIAMNEVARIVRLHD